jgi:hypothetical protein
MCPVIPFKVVFHREKHLFFVDYHFCFKWMNINFIYDSESVTIHNKYTQYDISSR